MYIPRPTRARAPSTAPTPIPAFAPVDSPLLLEAELAELVLDDVGVVGAAVMDELLTIDVMSDSHATDDSVDHDVEEVNAANNFTIV